MQVIDGGQRGKLHVKPQAGLQTLVMKQNSFESVQFASLFFQV